MTFRFEAINDLIQESLNWKLSIFAENFEFLNVHF